MAWREAYSYEITFTSLTAGSGATFVDGELRIDTDADFEFTKTTYSPVDLRVRARYRDDTNGRFLMKASQDLRTIGGATLFNVAPGNPTPPGFVPFIWPKPYIINAATTLTVSLADFSGLVYSPRIAFHGSKIRPGTAPWDRKYRAVVPYVYALSTTGTVAVGANGTSSASIATDNDAHFMCYKIVGARTGPCTVTIKDGARDRQWTNQAIHFDNFVGNGGFPHILASPRFIGRGSVVAVSLTDLSGASNTVEMNLVGVKLYE